ncbi:MAG: hypothetical protein ACPG77_18320, partial [Nannocystaceae bacterium]
MRTEPDKSMPPVAPGTGPGAVEAETRATAGVGRLGPATADHMIYTGVELDGRYRIIRPIGRGGMGTIFLGEHMGIDKEV